MPMRAEREVSWKGQDLILAVRAQPGARRTEVAGVHGTSIKIRLRARAIEGEANEALVTFLADEFGVPARSVSIEAGEQSRSKRVRVARPDPALVAHALRRWGVALPRA